MERKYSILYYFQNAKNFPAAGQFENNILKPSKSLIRLTRYLFFPHDFFVSDLLIPHDADTVTYRPGAHPLVC